MKEYDINSIKSLSFAEGVRERIPMYLGSSDMEGVYNGIQEIISNSIDEFYQGAGKIINITLNDLDGGKKSIKIEDFGRGVPFGSKKDGSNVLVDIFSKPHTGGKFDNDSYKQSSGLNGIGAKATALSSEWFVVESYRKGVKARAKFVKGVLESYEEAATDRKDGTIIEFVPDGEVFSLEEIDINYDKIAERCRNLSYLTKGLKFVLVYNNKKDTFYTKNGLKDLVKENARGVHPTILHAELEENGNHIEIALQWTSNREEKFFVFTNGLRNIEGGTSLTGVRTALTRILKKEIGKDSEGSTIRNGLVYAISARVTNPSFANQTKTKVNNPELNGLAQKAVKIAMDGLVKNKPQEYSDIITMLTKTEKAEKAADKAREAVLEASKKVEETSSRKIIKSTKLKDAEFLGQDSTLLLVEGDSAASSIANSRDVKKYGILGLKGKMINCLTHTDEDIYSNEEILLLLQALNLNPKKYDSSKLRYGKIGICTDADADGAHIGLLIMAALYHLCPEFIREGRLAWLRAPLYIVKSGKKNHYYFTDAEYEKNTIKGEVSRAKGIGSLSPDQAKEALFGKNQRLELLVPDEDALPLLASLMGDDVQFRKNYIFNNVDFSKISE